MRTVITNSSFEKYPEWQKVFNVIETLSKAGFQTLLAGGCVRDALLERSLHDFDIATEATPDQVKRLFARTVNVGEAFGVTRVIVDESVFEIATFRGEKNYQDFRHPNEVYFTDAIEDARRRDFTINALFYDPLAEKVLDFVGGLDDLTKGVLQTVGNPSDRLNEDALRILRAVRFSLRLNFTIDTATFKAACDLRGNLQFLSGERLQEELLKIFATRPKRGDDGLRLFNSLTVMNSLGLSELDPPLTDRPLNEDFFCAGEKLLFAVYILLHADSEAALKAIHQRLKYSKEVASILLSLKRLQSLSASPAKLRREFLNLSHEIQQSLATQSSLQAILWNQPIDQLLAQDQWRNQHQAYAYGIKAKEIIALGLRPGIELGQALDLADQWFMEDRYPHSEDALKALKELIEGGFFQR